MTNVEIARRIRRRREDCGLSRAQVAQRLDIDVTAVAAWEAGRYLPRSARRAALASLLNTRAEVLFGGAKAGTGHANLIDTIDDLEPLLSSLVAQAQRSLKALRIAAPYSTAAYVQKEFRLGVANRILDRSIEVQRIEIFYDLARLKEVLSNIIRYNGCSYWVKSYCAGLHEVVPAMGGYFFDDNDFLIGAYWTGIPPHDRPGLHLSGEPFRTFFKEYWSEIWRRGTLLNNRGAHDLEEIRKVALKLGLASTDWSSFVKEAHTLEVGDGCPPLV